MMSNLFLHPALPLLVGSILIFIVKTKVNIPHTRMQDYYQDHDLFVLPATAEPASISVLESVGLGTPSICSDTNGTKFYLLENNFGLTFKDNNEDDLQDTDDNEGDLQDTDNNEDDQQDTDNNEDDY